MKPRRPRPRPRAGLVPRPLTTRLLAVAAGALAVDPLARPVEPHLLLVIPLAVLGWTAGVPVRGRLVLRQPPGVGRLARHRATAFGVVCVGCAAGLTSGPWWLTAADTLFFTAWVMACDLTAGGPPARRALHGPGAAAVPALTAVVLLAARLPVSPAPVAGRLTAAAVVLAGAACLTLWARALLTPPPDPDPQPSEVG